MAAREPALLLFIGEQAVAAEPLDEPADPGCPVQYLRFPLQPAQASALAAGRTSLTLRAELGGHITVTTLSAEAVAALASRGVPATPALIEIDNGFRFR